jgi:hypothetical protein
MTTNDNKLSIGDAVTLGMILETCQQNRPVTWLVRYPDTGELASGSQTISGTARAIVADNGGRSFVNADMDVRDGYVWISATMEHFMPVRDVIRWVQDGTFALNYRA